jgi:NAD(P)-dependent dehydrogenase (short-subunit alcohol dehydrogenase family)
MADLRYDGRVAVITGAGRGLGQSYAKLLASRGAKVVVNDLGGDTKGRGSSKEPATDTVAEITAAGGAAIANFGDVSNDADADALMQHAIEAFGRLDIVINNAGVDTISPFANMTRAMFDDMLRIHVGGSFAVTKAAWPHLMEQQYGRIVMTCSHAGMGMQDMAHYCTAKAGLIGLMRALSLEGRPHGINVNAIMPGAATRLMNESAGEVADAGGTAEIPPQELLDQMSPDLVAPPVAWLVHEDCAVTGEVVDAVAGLVGRVFFALTRGRVDRDLTIETVRDHWDKIADESSYTVGNSLYDAMGRMAPTAN